MPQFKMPAFIMTWIEHMFDHISARQIARERYFKRREKVKQTPQENPFGRERTTEKKDTIRQIRKIRLPLSTN